MKISIWPVSALFLIIFIGLTSCQFPTDTATTNVTTGSGTWAGTTRCTQTSDTSVFPLGAVSYGTMTITRTNNTFTISNITDTQGLVTYRNGSGSVSGSTFTGNYTGTLGTGTIAVTFTVTVDGSAASGTMSQTYTVGGAVYSASGTTSMVKQ